MKRAPVLLALLLAVTGLLAGSTNAASTAPTATVRLQALDRAVLGRLNATRASHGLHPVALSGDLQNAAVFHSRSMLEGGFFTHESGDGSPFSARIKRFYRPAGFDSWSVGENLLFSTTEIDAAGAVKAWLESPPHRKILLAPEWREVGIGSLVATAAGGTFGGQPTWVITMDFGVRSGTPAAKSVRRIDRVLPLPTRSI